MSDRDDLFLVLVFCFVCFVVGVMVGSVIKCGNEGGAGKVYVYVSPNGSLPDGLFPDSFVFENITVLESSGLLVVENLSMLEAFKDE